MKDSKVFKISIYLLMAVIFMTGVSFFRYRSKSNDIINNTNIITIYSNNMSLGDVSIPAGDVNGDGKVSANDYILVKKHLLNTSTLSGDEYKRADVNSDGSISTQDYILIKKIMLNLVEVSTPTPAPTPSPVPTATPTPTPAPTATPKPVKVSSFYINKYSFEMYRGDEATLSHKVNPSNATNKTVIWSSSNTDVATIDQNGLITAKNKGKTVITGKTVDGGYSDTCEVTVREKTLDCQAGTYANYQEERCKPCEKSTYCYGGTFDITQEYQRERYERLGSWDFGDGYLKCPDHFTSDYGASTISQCYLTITFEYNGGTESEKTRKRYYGEKLGNLPSTSRSGYTLIGWKATGRDGSVSPNDLVNNIFTTDVIWLNAMWASNSGPQATPVPPSKPSTNDNCKTYVYYQISRVKSGESNHCKGKYVAGLNYRSLANCQAVINGCPNVRCGQLTTTCCNCNDKWLRYED